MPKTKDLLTLEEIKPNVDNLSTEDQIDLKKYIENILDDKKENAKKEYELINGK